MKRYSTVVLGSGAGGTGLLVCAARSGRLARLLDHGVAVVERGDRMGAGRLGRYGLNSDSLATSFVECLETTAAREIFGGVSDLPITQSLIRRRRRHVPLADVADFLGHVGEAVQRKIERHPSCRFMARTEARSLRLQDDGSVMLELEPNGARVVARSVVLALGGRQDLDAALGERIAGLKLAEFADRVLLSDPITRENGEPFMNGRLPRRNPRVVIVGGSHGAFSVAWVLTRPGSADRFEPGSITILHRARLRVAYDDPERARGDGYTDFGDEDICPVTGRVHRLGGLRGDGREIWRRVTGRLEPAERRVRIEKLSEEASMRDRVRQLFYQADLIVPAFGYRARTLPVHDANGRRLRLLAEAGGVFVGDDGRVLLEDGTPLAQVFGIGMASGFRPPGERSFEGQVNGVWLYHNVYGERVLDGIAAVVE